MTTTEAPTTPTDSEVPQPKPKQVRGPRRRLLGDGDGDYCIYQVIPQGDPHIPGGSLVPIPGVPRFTDTVKATAWVRKSSGDLLAGKQIMVFRAMEILDIQVRTKTAVVIEAKSRRPAADPKTDDKA